MLVKVKPHSTLSKFFTYTDIEIELDSYFDLMSYLRSIHPKFIDYIRHQKANDIEEGYAILDKNLKEITYDDMMIRRLRDGDVIYIVPAIVGGGGKRGGLLAVFAAFAIFAFLPAAGFLSAGSGVVGAAGTGAAAAAGGKAAAGILSGGFLKNILVNVGLALLSSLFTKKPDTADKATRQNDMFGSLKNTTSSDTPVALNYGHVRVAGQMISGYIKTVNHERNANISVSEIVQQ